MSHAGGLRSHMRMTAVLRRDIAYGHIAPGASIPRLEYAERHPRPRFPFCPERQVRKDNHT